MIVDRPALGHVVSVNVGTFAPFSLPHGQTSSAIDKSPQASAVKATGTSLEGDDRAAHGGPDRALYAYALEDYAWWEVLLRRTLAPGIFGENLTTFGFDPNDSLVGERWAVGSAVFEVSQPRLPCIKLAARLQIPSFVRTFAKHVRPGSYLRVVSEGSAGSGDAIALDFRPSHDVSIRDIFRIYVDPSADASRLLTVPQLSPSWQIWAESAVSGRRQGRVRGTDLSGPTELGGLLPDGTCHGA